MSPNWMATPTFIFPLSSFHLITVHLLDALDGAQLLD
jgi:hypothetical protein